MSGTRCSTEQILDDFLFHTPTLERVVPPVSLHLCIPFPFATFLLIRRQTLTTKPASTASDFVRTLSTAVAVAETYDDPDGVSMKGVKISGRPLYLDMQATSSVDPRVVDAMLPYYLTRYGNPHSRTHMYGWESDSAVETARAQVADLIGASPKEIVFTSGATECNNISIKGVMHFYKDKKRHVITTQTEHKCVLDSCRHLQQEGYNVTYLPVKTDGLIDLDELRSSIRPDTGLVSVMAVNNEIGVIQLMEEIGEICKEFKIPFHTDAAQVLGKIPIDVDKWNVSLMSLSGHKVYGPKGIGALYMRRRPRIRVEPQMNGGGQERGIQSGTVPTPLVVGFGAACEIAKKEMEYDEKRVRALQNRMLKGIRKNLDMVVVNGSEERHYPGNLNRSAHKIVPNNSGTWCFVGMIAATVDVTFSDKITCCYCAIYMGIFGNAFVVGGDTIGIGTMGNSDETKLMIFW
ncbi:cysteine desulfurase, mitochondrial-like [Pyrus communis]|uniref:cysteine desulfurase, mitochondrial-like n=1 Tax=Pyrus communis TaxID=23211 RepID=UPI0035BFC5C4